MGNGNACKSRKLSVQNLSGQGVVALHILKHMPVSFQGLSMKGSGCFKNDCAGRAKQFNDSTSGCALVCACCAVQCRACMSGLCVPACMCTLTCRVSLGKFV